MNRKIELMHSIFGCDAANRCCGECSNLITGRYHDVTYRKCAVYGLTHSEATDWRKKWPACGKFNAEYAGRPIVRLVVGGRNIPNKPEIEGQMALEV